MTTIPTAPSGSAEDVLATVYQLVKDHPDWHDNGAYNMPPQLLESRPACGTTHCIAGWMAIASPDVQYDEANVDFPAWNIVTVLESNADGPLPGKEWVNPWDWASDLLELNDPAAAVLFGEEHSTEWCVGAMSAALEALRAGGNVSSALLRYDAEMRA